MERDTILITDDVDLNRELIKFIFEEEYQILEANDGQRAIEIIQENSERLCLIFLDLIMPIKSGVDVLEFMNKEHYIESIPAIMITGETMDEAGEKALEYGASDIIYKPFSPNVIMRRAKRIMELYEYKRNMDIL